MGSRVGWRDSHSQNLRFDVIWKLLSINVNATICDYGCGTGDFLKFARDRGWKGAYVGVDISEAMVSQAKVNALGDGKADFIVSSKPMAADVVVASGIFNVSLGVSTGEWSEYCRQCISQMWAETTTTICFNMLSVDSDLDFRSRELSYFDPSEWLSFVRTTCSNIVSLDQSYGLFDFTVAAHRCLRGKSLEE